MQDVCSRRRSSLSPACWGPSDHSVGRVDRWEKGVVVAEAAPRCLSSNEVAIVFSRLAVVLSPVSAAGPASPWMAQHRRDS